MFMNSAAAPPRARQATRTCWAAKAPTWRKCVPGHSRAGGLHRQHRVLHGLLRRRLQAPPGLTDQVLAALKKTETIMGMTYGDAVNPLLLSCRSGARSSMPGMMDTVLNVGLSTATIPGIIAKTKNPRFVWDSYRRLIMMYADVVMEKAEGLEPALGKGIRKILDEKLDEVKHAKGCKSDTDLGADDLKALAEAFKELVHQHLGKPFPDDPLAQMWGGIAAVFKSWNGKRPSPTAASRAFRTSGAPPSTSRRWCSATWATPPPPAWPSPATRPPATTSSTASGW